MLHKFIGLFAFVALCSAQKIPVTVYYESLCPDSQAFITQQLYPQLKQGLADRVEVKWIPFGKSKFETRGSDVEFECHHGPNECYGNKVQSCAIQHIQSNSYENQYTRESLILEFINCLMKSGKNFPDNIYPGERCAHENHINNWEVIAQCANSTEGSNLLKQNGELTKAFQPELQSVPTVTFNHQFDKEVQAMALTNFRSVICTFFSIPKPQLCVANGDTGTTAAVSLVLGAAYSAARIL